MKVNQILFSVMVFTALAISPSINAATVQDPYTTINLNPALSYSGEGEHSLSWQGVWGRQGFNVYTETLGYTTIGNAQAYAYVQSTQVEGGRGNNRYASAEAQLIYYLTFEANDPLYSNFAHLNMDVHLQASREGGAAGGSDPTAAISSLQMENLTTNEFMVDYNTNNDYRFNDGLYTDGDRLRAVETTEKFAVGTVFEVRLSSFASTLVPNNTVDPQTYKSSAWIDPFFYFNQEAYDAARLLDPSLPDIILADEFTIIASTGINVQPVPVPAAIWLLASGLLALMSRFRQVNIT